MIKKLLLGLWITSLLAVAGLATINTVNAQANDVTFTEANSFGAWNTDDIAVWWADKGGWLITVIKNFINWMLGLLSLMALIVLLYGGFNMVTAAWEEEKYKKGFTIMKQAWVGLAVIGLSWFIVSIIFWVIGSASGTAT